MPTMKRCLAAVNVYVRATQTAVELQAGMDVDLDRELAPGFTLGDAVAGREDCFEPIGDDPPADEEN